MTKYLGQIDEGEVKVKRNIVYEGIEQEWYIAVHSTKSALEKVDYGLCRMSTENKTHVKYISFKNSTKADKIAGLKLNCLLNVRLKYEWLEDVNVLAAARYKGQKSTVG